MGHRAIGDVDTTIVIGGGSTALTTDTDWWLVRASGGHPAALTLPANPDDGDAIAVADGSGNAGTQPIGVQSDPATAIPILGTGGTSIDLATDYGALVFIYSFWRQAWVVYALGAGAPVPPTPVTQLTDAVDTSSMAGSGQFGYLAAAGMLAPTDAGVPLFGSGSGRAARVYGVYEGTSGECVTEGVVDDALFTTDGGAPVPGAPVWLALASADTGTGAGKLTATPPAAVVQTAGALAAQPVLAEVGICKDASAYAASKRAKVRLQFKAPVQLGGQGLSVHGGDLWSPERVQSVTLARSPFQVLPRMGRVDVDVATGNAGHANVVVLLAATAATDPVEGQPLAIKCAAGDCSLAPILITPPVGTSVEDPSSPGTLRTSVGTQASLKGGPGAEANFVYDKPALVWRLTSGE